MRKPSLYPQYSVRYSKAPFQLLQILNLAGFLGTLVVNYLANALPIHGKTTGELADQYPNLFTPAGLTFSIWGLIYLLLAAFCVYQARGLFGHGKAGEHRLLVRKIGYLFFISCLANISWIVAWHYERVGISVGIMVVLFFSLLQIYLRLRRDKQGTWQEKYLFQIPFSVYLGWISVATMANITAWLVDSGWSGGTLSEETWAIGLVGVAALLGIFMLLKRRDTAFAMVIAWALLGILIKRLANSSGALTPLIIATIVCLFLLAISILLVTLRPQAKTPA
jgi:hypothetical protein